jgi:hypothetical protein
MISQMIYSLIIFDEAFFIQKNAEGVAMVLYKD